MNPNQFARRAAIVLLVGGSAPLDAGAQGAASLDARTSSAIDSFVTATMRTRRVPGAAVAVVDHGTVVYRKGFGLANLETQTPVTLNSVFELASLTKEFTAAAIMMLVEEGRVKLDAPISTYIDSAPPAWAPITVRHLLTHTSGIFAGGVVFRDGSPLYNVTTRQAFEWVAAARTFPPGDVGVYSDGGYFLLGMVIERASGLTYREFVQRRIFAPLGMSGASLTDHRRVLAGRVATYDVANGQLVNWRRDWDYELPSFFGVWATLDDVVKWDAGLARHTVLSQASLDQMWAPGKLTDGRDALVDAREYGFGFRIDQIRGRPVVWHNGASGTIALHFLDQPLSVIVLTNLANTAGRHPTTLADGIAGLVRPEYMPAQRLVPRADPTPEVTRAMQSMLRSLGEGRMPGELTAAHAAYIAALPQPVSDGLRTVAAAITALTFIACDDVAERHIHITDPIARVCYYKGTSPDRTTYFTIWLTADGKAAHLRTAGEDDY